MNKNPGMRNSRENKVCLGAKYDVCPWYMAYNIYYGSMEQVMLSCGNLYYNLYTMYIKIICNKRISQKMFHWIYSEYNTWNAIGLQEKYEYLAHQYFRHLLCTYDAHGVSGTQQYGHSRFLYYTERM